MMKQIHSEEQESGPKRTQYGKNNENNIASKYVAGFMYFLC